MDNHYSLPMAEKLTRILDYKGILASAGVLTPSEA